MESLKAAFAAGADAVYFGLPAFNARQRAKNIEPRHLPGIVSEATLRGIKLYLTLNTLVTEDEIPQVLEIIDTAMAAGIKAFIIQDMGLLYILKKGYPEAEIHVSTQATTHTEGQIRFLSKCGVNRINLARELTIDEVRKLTALAHSLGTETEVFVHGSYCLSYSGQCYLCSFLEGCSGNRGLCQQNCRRLYRKGARTDYFLNLKDNSAIRFTEELALAGVDSLKIEGRIKSPAYVYSAVKGWKLLAENLSDEGAAAEAKALFDGVFNRDFTDSYLEGNIGSSMFSESPQDKSLRQVATVLSYTADSALLATDSMPSSVFPSELVIKDAEGKFICSARAEEEAEIPEDNSFLKAESRRSAVFCCRIKITGKLEGKITKGCAVYASRPALKAGEAEKSVENVVFRKIPVTATVSVGEGKPFVLELDALGKKGIYKSGKNVSLSLKTPVTKDSFTKQLSRFGSTPFELENIIFSEWDENLFIPVSEINSARRKCAAQIMGTIDSPRAGVFLESYNRETTAFPGEIPEKPFHKVQAGKEGGKSKLTVFLDSQEAARSLRSIYGGEIEIMFEVTDPSEEIDESFIPVFPSVMELEAEKEYENFIKNSRHNLVVLNNTALAMSAAASAKKWIAGNYLNITNSLALKLLADTQGCSGAIASLELSSRQGASLAAKSPLPISFFIYSAVRLMTTRQCLLEYRCGKKTSGKSCYYSCAGEESIDAVRGKSLRICKRKWNHTELYDSSFLSIPEIVTDLSGTASGFIIDLRLLSFSGHNSENISEITAAFKQFIDNPDTKGKNRINQLCVNVSRGNAAKGLS